MAKEISFEYGKKTYTLGYTRKTVEAMERSGFIIGEVFDKPATGIPALFAGAFKAHHPNVNYQLTREIYAHMPDREKLIGKLAEMYNEPIQELLAEPEETEGNVSWTASW